PFEMSGGMNRRVLVATAIGSGADLIVADEPTPGLDPLVLLETVKQMKNLVTEEKAMMFITHDLDLALSIADKIVVFNEGKTVEVASIEQFHANGEQLKHAYTKALWQAMPQNTFIPSISYPNVKEKQNS